MKFFEAASISLFVAIADGAIETLVEHAQQELGDFEAGGVLIGERREMGYTIVKCTKPQPADRRGPYHFRRREQGHQEAVNDAWKSSNRCQSYIGEWHSHPESIPTPSLIDRIGWAKRACAARKPLAVIIVGRQDLYVAIQHGFHLTRLAETR